MNPAETLIHAQRIVRDYLDDGIEFAYVYEDEALADNSDASEEAWRAVHDQANSILRSLTETVGML